MESRANHTDETSHSVGGAAMYALHQLGGAAREVVVSTGVTIWVVIIVVALWFIAVACWDAYKQRRLWYRYIDCGRCFSRYVDSIVSCSERKTIDYTKLQLSGPGYSYSMWLYIADWYKNGFTKWKSIFYRGDRLPSVANCPNVDWDTPKGQSPGIWFSDVQNNLRVVINTTLTLPSKCVDDIRERELPGAEGFVSGDGRAHPSRPGDATVEGFTGGGKADDIEDGVNWSRLGVCSASSSTLATKQIKMADYLDLRNVPIGQWFHLTMCVRKREVEIYMDGELHQTKVMVGTPDFTTDRQGFFGARNPFYGRLACFRFMPHRLPATIVKMLHEYELHLPFRHDPDPMGDRGEV